jgi:hypothetical protein
LKQKADRLIPCGSFVRGDWRVALKELPHEFDTGFSVAFKLRIGQTFAIPNGVTTPEIGSELGRILKLTGSSICFNDTPTEEESRQIRELWYLATRETKSKKRRGQDDIAVKWSSFIDGVLRKLRPPEQFSIAIIPVLSSAGSDPHDASLHSEFYLDSARKLLGEFSLRIVALPTGTRDVSDATPPAVIRRLLNYGDSYFEHDSERWSQRCGLLQLSPWVLNSLQRVIRLVESSILHREIVAKRLSTLCPICEERFITSSGSEQGFSRECRSCGTLWGLTKCKWCSHTFPWLRLRRKQWEPGSADVPYGRWIEKIELAAGAKAFPSFCESSESRPVAVPICPRCGQCPHKAEIENCARCSSAFLSKEIRAKAATTIRDR